MAKVAVTRVIVEYVCEKKKFRLEFDPATVGSIIFHEPDLKRQQFGQKEGVPNDGIPAMPLAATHKPVATQPLIQQLSGKNAGILSELPAAMVSDDPPGPPLWWHTTLCSWFHPE